MNFFAQQEFRKKIRYAIMGIALAVCGLPSAAIAGGGSLAQQWVARYDGPANSSDYAKAGVVDSRDNVIVSGPSVGIVNGVNSSDTATIKYNSRGQQVWVARDIGSYGANDVAVDTNDNVYVTGNSFTIKYSSAGSIIWRVAETGTMIAADAAGNAYLTSGAITVKLDSATGARQWARGIGGRGIALDAVGSVYVIGGSGTFKLDPSNGQTLWTAPVTAGNARFPLAVDANGNVYVTGGNIAMGGSVTAKYDTNGNELWMTSSMAAYALTVDAAGNAYIVPGTGMNVSKFDSTIGNVLWTTSAGAGYAINLAVSSKGDVYVGGGDGGYNFLTGKINSAGVYQASVIYDNRSWDDVWDFVMDSRGNPIVIGESFSVINGRTQSDFALVKYSR